MSVECGEIGGRRKLRKGLEGLEGFGGMEGWGKEGEERERESERSEATTTILSKSLHAHTKAHKKNTHIH